MEVITSARRVQLTKWLLEAEEAYHLAVTGGGVRTVVDQNGERIEYSAANPGRLSAYIAWLKGQLGLSSSSGPMDMWM